MTAPSHGQAVVEALGVLESAFAGLRTTVTSLAISREAAVQLLELALHLRKHGERAPGGNETWADFDRKAEDYLRTGRLPSYPRVRVPENTGKHPAESSPIGTNADVRCRCRSCPDFGDPDFGEGTCPSDHADPTIWGTP